MRYLARLTNTWGKKAPYFFIYEYTEGKSLGTLSLNVFKNNDLLFMQLTKSVMLQNKNKN